MDDRDALHMRRALQLAGEGWGLVAPNPLVGAVLVHDGRVVGEGHHARFGGPHAEVSALQEAGEAARGATLYVNLEPCHHVGKTGPCTRAIVEAGVARVVCAVADTNPAAAGGISWLRAQGVQVDVGLLEREARDLNAIHLSTPARDRPFIALKYALSLDARLSEEPGRPTRVTVGEAVVAAHRLRAGHDALMVGIGTVLADDPELTVRDWRAPRVAPARVVLDSELRTPLDSKLVKSAREAPVRLFANDDVPAEHVERLRALGARVDSVPRSEAGGGLDLRAVLAVLRSAGLDSVLCEGGGKLGSALLSCGLVDRLYVFIAPRLFGEPGVRAFQGDLGRAAAEWRLIERKALAEVTLLALSPTPSERG
jgi:diaminohydroxyphosphoribosylaminopyrimidine deaminase/5-amino-6-(5-phosphoribosylamino)uracil reductase